MQLLAVVIVLSISDIHVIPSGDDRIRLQGFVTGITENRHQKTRPAKMRTGFNSLIHK
jgi:hypothetical protein